MRILHVSPYYYPSVGGLQRHIRALSERLAARGHDVTVVTSRLAGGASKRLDTTLPDRETVGGVEVHRYNGLRPVTSWIARVPGTYRVLGPDKYRALVDGPWWPGALSFAARLRPDIIMVMSAEHEALLLQFSWLARRLHVPLAVRPLLHTEHAWSRSPLVLRLLSRCDAVIASTPYERAYVERHCLPAPRAFAVPVGVDPAAFAQRDGRAVRAKYGLGDRVVVGYVARLQVDKGVTRLLDAMRRVWRDAPDVLVLLAGHRFAPGSEADRPVQQMLDALSPEERARVTLTGGFADAEKASIFDACDVFAMPSIAESFGGVYLEAWLCGKPVVGSRISAVSCVVDEGVDGLLAAPDDAGELAGAILRLVGDPGLRRRMGEHGRQKTMQRYAWERVTEGVESIYRDLVAGSAGTKATR